MAARSLLGLLARFAVIGLTAMGLGAAVARADVPPTAVDLALVLAIDVSGSIDEAEAKLQRQGYIDAFRDPALSAVIANGPRGKIAVTYFEWSSHGDHRLVADWTVIDGLDAARGFAETLANEPIRIGLRTSISGAIEYGIVLLERAPMSSGRRTIDISGDGPNNDGRFILDARQQAIDRGIAINGLPIINDRPNRFGFPNLPDLDLYYEHCVVAGGNAFVIVARDFNDFAAAVKRKLVMEIAEAPTPGMPLRHAAASPRVGYPPGCDVGERQSREFWQRRGLN